MQKRVCIDLHGWVYKANDGENAVFGHLTYNLSLKIVPFSLTNNNAIIDPFQWYITHAN